MDARNVLMLARINAMTVSQTAPRQLIRNISIKISVLTVLRTLFPTFFKTEPRSARTVIQNALNVEIGINVMYALMTNSTSTRPAFTPVLNQLIQIRTKFAPTVQILARIVLQQPLAEDAN
jgi:hypothetical protein